MFQLAKDDFIASPDFTRKESCEPFGARIACLPKREDPRSILLNVSPYWTPAQPNT
jgi:hypothetical protein